ncbi:polysaccharide deacetylase [Bacteroidia bacterium]|nr:polysaccharide deacetylase [Bacteroidia bacterium]
MRFVPFGFIRRLIPSVIWSFDTPDRVFLTFDDGPTPEVTEWVLGQLAAYDAKATFFCLGKNAELHPHLHRMIVEAGHKVGNHTYSHQKGWEQGLERYVEDVDFANQILRSDLLRPPYGRITPAQVKALGERYNIIMWDVLSRDYSRYVSPQSCVRNTTRYIRPGSIIVFHDSNKAFRNLRYALPRVLDYISRAGLKCSAIDL